MSHRILRLTRHEATTEQEQELRRIFGEDVEIFMISETVPGVERVKELLQEHNASVLEAVLPMKIVADCVDVRIGIKVPLVRAITRRELLGDGSAVFHFSHYEKVVKVEVVIEKL